MGTSTPDWSIEGILASPYLWGFICLVATGVALSGKLDVSAAKWVLVGAWGFAIFSCYRFAPILRQPPIPRLLWIMLATSVTGLLLFYIANWMTPALALKPSPTDQAISDLDDRITKLSNALAQSPLVDRSVQLSILKDEHDRLSKKREELTKQEKETLDTQALTLQSLEDGKKRYLEAKEVAKQQSELAAQQERIKRENRMKGNEQVQIDVAKQCGPIIDHAIATLYQMLRQIEKETGEPLSTDFPRPDRPSIYDSTMLREGKIVGGQHIMRVGSNKDWEFQLGASGPGKSADMISLPDASLVIKAGLAEVIITNGPYMPSHSATLHLTLWVYPFAGARKVGIKPSYQEECSLTDYHKPIERVLRQLIQSRYIAAPLKPKP